MRAGGDAGRQTWRIGVRETGTDRACGCAGGGGHGRTRPRGRAGRSVARFAPRRVGRCYSNPWRRLQHRQLPGRKPSCMSPIHGCDGTCVGAGCRAPRTRPGDPVTSFLVLIAALAPAWPIRQMALFELEPARDVWLRLTLFGGVLYLIASGEYWLACIGLWFVCRWQGTDQLASLVTWIAIGAGWFALRSAPSGLYHWLPTVWSLIAYYQVGVMLYRLKDYRALRRIGESRPRIMLGSAAAGSMFFALLAPLAPVWALPAVALGLVGTCSWLAFLASGAALLWLHPSTWL